VHKILLVDDDPDIRKIAVISLQHVGGFEVRTAVSGEDGLSVAGPWQPDLVLLDVMMPGLDGPSTFARLREDPATRDIPVVFMTAKVQQREVQRYLALGACGVIAKPFDPMTLSQQIRDIASGRA
jgi:two-component system OmpR family response regulator